MHAARFAAVTIIALIGTVRNAAADQLPMIPQAAPAQMGSFYVSLGGQGHRVEIPEIRGNFSRANTTQNFLTAKPSLVATGPAITAGYVLDLPIGTRPRIEAAFSFLYGTGEDTTVVNASNFNVAFRTVDGLTVDNNCCIGGIWTSHLRTVLNSADAAIRIKTDFLVMSNFVVTPGIGVVGGWTYTKQTINYFQRDPLNLYIHVLDQRITTGRVGGELSLDGSFAVTRSILLHGGVSGAAYHQKTNFNGESCFNTDSNLGGCNGQFDTRSTFTTSRNRFGGRLGMSAGATVGWGWAQISVLGSAVWNLNTPYIRSAVAYEPGPSSIQYRNTWNYGGFAMISIPLGR